MIDTDLVVSGNSCTCIKQIMTSRVCPDCDGLIYSMPVLVDELERLTKEVERLQDALYRISIHEQSLGNRSPSEMAYDALTNEALGVRGECDEKTD